MPLGSDGSPYGYYIYTPSGYTAAGPRFPLLIFLHGWGQIGNSRNDPSALDAVMTDGPPRLIHEGRWHPEYPMVVVSPQCDDNWWDDAKVKSVVEFLMSTYRVDTTRIYITGLSMGGCAAFDQIMNYGGASHLTAVVPIAGTATMSGDGVNRASHFPTWAFHGENDQTISPDFDIQFHQAVNEQNPAVREQLTMFADTGHDCWTETYDGTGMGHEDPQYDPFSMAVYTWMLEYAKDDGSQSNDEVAPGPQPPPPGAKKTPPAKGKKGPPKKPQ
jgi:predicted peptidase